MSSYFVITVDGQDVTIAKYSKEKMLERLNNPDWVNSMPIVNLGDDRMESFENHFHLLSAPPNLRYYRVIIRGDVVIPTPHRVVTHWSIP